MSSAAQSFDVVFAGGGIVGTACAYACAQAGMRVALVEATFLAAAQRPALDDCRFHFRMCHSLSLSGRPAHLGRSPVPFVRIRLSMNQRRF
jgi:folate-dependent tRNA-U54 methylase TrmFO/GidA